MERDFRYLRDKHGDAGAREAFENICVELFQNIHKNAYPVKAFPGDDGIDILVGELTEPITVFQCKYFMDGIGNSQKSQIKDSYKMVKDKYKVKEWYLCVPIIFTINDHKWWSDWKSSNNDEDITIGLYEGSTLLNKLKKFDLYNRIFDDDIRNMLGEYGEKLGNIEEHIMNINKKSVFEIGNYYKLPMQSKIFNGRFAELTDVSEGLENNRIVVLYGVTGIGKSQIAKQYAYIHREEYRKIYWIFASSKNELLREYHQIAKVSNLPTCNEEDEDLLVQIVKHHFESENDSLIIYDGLDDMDIGEIKEYLPNGDVDILITTKNSNWDCNEVTVVNVNFIEPQDAIDFIMNNSLGRNISSKDSEDIKLLVKELSYYPLGLEYARAYIVARNISISEYFELFKKCRIGARI